MIISAKFQRRAVLLLAAASLACAPAPRSGEEVHIAEESAIIIWDAAAKTQHFIRRASFDTKAKDFGFLVPTPTVPRLEEADDQAFSFLADLTAPKVRQPDPTEKSARQVVAAPAAAPVEVIATKRIAGYDAAVLRASDAGALDGWLKDNGYASSPELVDWYKPYLARNWIITAFKIAKDNAAPVRVAASAVRMSFETEKPFFPYREPAADRPKSSSDRMLRVFLLADGRQEGRIGTDASWNGKTVWAGRVADGSRARLMELLKLPEDTAKAVLHLTEFEDSSSPRPGVDDLFFRIASDQSQVLRREIYPHGGVVRSDLEQFAMIAGVALAISVAIFWGGAIPFGVLFLLYRFIRRTIRPS